MIDQHPIVIGIGGNIGSDAILIDRFRKARERIGMFGVSCSAPLYRTAPIGPLQPPFLNTAVVLTNSALDPASLMTDLLAIERMLGRTREDGERFGPRALDLDVLVWGRREIHTPELQVPHPRLGERRFALEPLVALLGPTFEVSGLGTLGPLLERVRGQQVEQIAELW